MLNFQKSGRSTGERSAMTFDPRTFHPMVVTDTCSVWNVLSARKLYHAVFATRLTFCITPMVLYECIQKPRRVVTDEMAELLTRLELVRKKGRFPLQACGLDDLMTVIRTAPTGLSSGELSCIAVAYHLSTMAVMTDERQARHFAREKLGLRVETTPRLYGWLHFHMHLMDGDHSEIVAEHEKYERRPLTKFLNEAYESALQYRLIEHQ